MAKNNYTSKATTSKISATSRTSIKIRDTFYTLEFTEERLIPDVPDVDIAKERELLWDTVNSEVDHQVEEVQLLYKK